MKTKHLNVVLAIPSTTVWNATFALSVINLISYFANIRVPGYGSQQIRTINKRGSILPNLRLGLLKEAKECEATHILWLDSDHTFPADLLHALLARQKDVVALNCPTKCIPVYPTARAFDPEDPKGQPVYTREKSSGLERVWRVGFGITLMSERAYLQIPHEAFAMHYEEHADSFRGEDWGVCAALEEKGCPIYIDHTMSKLCKHVGTFDFDLNLTEHWDDVS